MMSNKCMHVAADTLRYTFGDDFTSLMKSDPTNAMAWADALIVGSGTKEKPIAPVTVYFGSKDVTVPPIMGKLYRARMCKMGGNVARVQLPGEQTHFSTPGVAQPLYLPWIADRFAGRPVANGCVGE